MKKLILSLAIALFLLNGCRTKEIIQYVDREVVVNRDSIVEKIIKDTFFIYPPQDNKVIAKDSSYLKTDLAFSFAKIQPDGLLFHSIENFRKIPGKVINQNTKVNNNKKTIVTIKITRTITKLRTDWIWWTGLASLAALLIFIVLKAKKLFLP